MGENHGEEDDHTAGDLVGGEAVAEEDDATQETKDGFQRHNKGGNGGGARKPLSYYLRRVGEARRGES